MAAITMTGPFLPATMADAVLDLSHWQSPINFGDVKDAGIVAVILKATQGTSFADSTFATRVTAATQAGLLVGAYHFFDATDATKQTQWMLDHVGDVKVLAIDFEPSSSDAAVEQNVATMCQALHDRDGRWPLLYTGRWNVPVANATLTQCPLWLPEWGTDPVPPPGWDRWTLWQYTAQATVPGVGGACDRNRFAGTVAELREWWEGTVAPAPVVTVTLPNQLQGTDGQGNPYTVLLKLGQSVLPAAMVAAMTFTGPNAGTTAMQPPPPVTEPLPSPPITEPKAAPPPKSPINEPKAPPPLINGPPITEPKAAPPPITEAPTTDKSDEAPIKGLKPKCIPGQLYFDANLNPLYAKCPP